MTRALERADRPRIIWHGKRPSRRDRMVTQSELADLLANGLRHPADLITHSVWLDNDPYGRVVSCWGQKGSGSFHAELFETPEYVRLSEVFG